MDIDTDLVEWCSRRLWEAECQRVPTEALTKDVPALDRATAYAIQRATFRRRGAALAGFKLGGTVRPSSGVDRRSYGRLSVAHRMVGVNEAIDPHHFLNPCVEPEIALRLARDLAGHGHTQESVAAHLDAVIPALEIADTRFADYPAALVDNIADNSSSGAFVLGEPVAWSQVRDVRGVEVCLYDGEALIGRGLGAEAMGDPLLVLAWLAAELAACGEVLPAGSVAMTGGLTNAAMLRSGKRFRATFGDLGEVSLRIT